MQIKEELGNRKHPPVKTELTRGRVKTEVKAELAGGTIPRPPALPPNAPRGVVTVGDDSDGEVQDEASISAAVKKGRSACISQLAKTIFHKERATNEAARERLGMLHYATRVASKPRFPRELFVLRGSPGVGKTEYAMQQLREYVDFDTDEELSARLTHVCSFDDFFETFQHGESSYEFKLHKLESYLARNETRTRLAMEAGIHPLYVDCPNLRLWEMRPYILLADRLGYVTTIVDPQTICEKWNDADYLTVANDTPERKNRGKHVERGTVTAFLNIFESLQSTDDAVAEIRNSKRPEGSRVVEAIRDEPEAKKPTKAPVMVAGKGKTWQHVKVEQGQKRPAPAISVQQPAKAPRYLPTPVVRTGYYGR